MKPATRFTVEASEAALSITNREDEDNSFLKYKRAAAVPPPLNKEEVDTAVGVNSLRHQLDEDVAVAYLLPRGCTASQANSTRIPYVDVAQAKAYAHKTVEADEELPEVEKQHREAHACAGSRA